MRNRELSAALAVAAFLVHGCGGSGSESMGPSTLSSAPGEAALAGFLQANHQYSLNATDAVTRYTVQLSNVPNPGVTQFNGNAPAYSSLATIAVSKNGVQFASSVSTSYYLLNPYVPLGSVSSTGTPYAVVTSSFPIPATISVGNSGAFVNLTYYHDSTMATVDADETTTYSVTTHDSTTLLLCLNSTISGVTAVGLADGMTSATESDCYTVDASGSAALVSVALTVDGVTLNFK